MNVAICANGARSYICLIKEPEPSLSQSLALLLMGS